MSVYHSSPQVRLAVNVASDTVFLLVVAIIFRLGTTGMFWVGRILPGDAHGGHSPVEHLVPTETIAHAISDIGFIILYLTVVLSA